jgi:hypothetical protein
MLTPAPELAAQLTHAAGSVFDLERGHLSYSDAISIPPAASALSASDKSSNPRP